MKRVLTASRILKKINCVYVKVETTWYSSVQYTECFGILLLNAHYYAQAA